MFYVLQKLSWYSYAIQYCINPQHNWIKKNMEHDIDTLRPRQNGCYLTDNIFKYILLAENVYISLKPLSGLMMVSLLTHIYVNQPQWVNT